MFPDVPFQACTIGRCATRKARKRARLSEESDEEDEEDEEDQVLSAVLSASDDVDGPWGRLARWEATNEPAKLRRHAYEQSVDECQRAFRVSPPRLNKLSKQKS